MKKQVPPSVGIIVVVVLVAGISIYFYKFMHQKVEYTIMPEPMVGIGEGRGNVVPPSEAALSRLIVGLDSLMSDSDDSTRLSAEQVNQVLPLLKSVQSLSEPSERECDGILKKVENVLTEEQKKAAQEKAKEVSLNEEHPLHTEAVQQHLEQVVKRLEQAEAS